MFGSLFFVSMLGRINSPTADAVFSVYDDTEDRVAAALASVYERDPDFTGVSPNDRVEHLCWAVSEGAVIDAVRDALRNTDVFIADGHHRYTTALNYRASHPDAAEAQACLMVLVATKDPGMIVLPTHRVLCGLEGFDASRLESRLLGDGRFSIRKTDHGEVDLAGLAAILPEAGHHALGLFDPRDGATYVVTSGSPDPLGSEVPDRAEVWRRLDVAVFHELLVDRLLRPAFGGESITYKYPHELSELARLSNEASDRLGVVLQATPLQSVIDVSLAGEVMPPKSTFFFPKLATGLIINPLS